MLGTPGGGGAPLGGGTTLGSGLGIGAEEEGAASAEADGAGLGADAEGGTGALEVWPEAVGVLSGGSAAGALVGAASPLVRLTTR